MKIIYPFCLVLALLAASAVGVRAVDGTFIQLHRDSNNKTTEDWRADFKGMKELGISTLIVQWTAEEPILYFGASIRELPYMSETYPVLERIFDAAEAEELQLILGLQHSPEYWEQIKSRDKVVRDFFRLRVARNERIQALLLEQFGARTAWKGYYIPDEVDDLTWRAPGMRDHIHMYLKVMAQRLRANDPDRPISVSAFFRGRTAPDLLAENFMDIFGGTGIDHLLLQDGIGVGDPPLRYLPLYYDILLRAWTAPAGDEAEARPALPRLWCVLEVFQQTSGPGQPFTAEPAPPKRIKQQLAATGGRFDRIILFTYSDYLAPSLGKGAEQARGALKAEAGTQ